MLSQVKSSHTVTAETGTSERSHFGVFASGVFASGRKHQKPSQVFRPPAVLSKVNSTKGTSLTLPMGDVRQNGTSISSC